MMVLLLLAYLSWWEHCVIQRLGFEFQIYHLSTWKLNCWPLKNFKKNVNDGVIFY